VPTFTVPSLPVCVAIGGTPYLAVSTSLIAVTYLIE